MFLVFNVVFAQYVIARPLAGRGTPEDWSTTAYAAAPPIIAGIAAVAMLPRNDVLVFCHRERSVAIPKIGVRSLMQAAPPIIAG